MDKETTPQTYAAWKASIDDTGSICRMGPIWETMERLEMELKAIKKCERCGLELPKDTRPSVYGCVAGSGCADYSMHSD